MIGDISGKLTGPDFELTYALGSDDYARIDGRGKIQPGIPIHAAKYGPKRPPPLPPTDVAFSGYVRQQTASWCWRDCEFTLADGRTLWGPDGKPNAPELTTAVVNRWQKSLRDAWAAHAVAERFVERRRLERLYGIEAYLRERQEYFLNMAIYHKYAEKKLAERLTEINDNPASPLLVDAETERPIWWKALYLTQTFVSENIDELVAFAKLYEPELRLKEQT